MRMWAHFCIISLISLLSACGFQPIHGQSYQAAQVSDLAVFAIEVSGTDITPSTGGRNTAIPRRYSELLKAELTDQINPRGEKSEDLYALIINFTEMQAGQFVNPDGTASRGDLVYDSSYSIRRLSDEKLITTGRIRRVSSYNTSQIADYASYVSIEDARKRGMMELARDYKLRLAGLKPMLDDPASTLNTRPPETEKKINSKEGWSSDIQPRPMYETLRPRQ